MVESAGVTKVSLFYKNNVPDVSDERRQYEDPDRRRDYRAGSGPSHALGATGGAHAVEAPHQSDDHGEHEGLEQTLRQIVIFQSLPGSGPVFGKRQAQHGAGDKIAADQADEIRD